MTHEEFLKAVQNERSIINRLLKSKAKRERAIKRLIQERYAFLEGKFCKVDDKYFYIVEIFGREEVKGVKLIAHALILTSIDLMFKGELKTLGFAFEHYSLSSEELLKAEQNIISKEKVFNHIGRLMNEIKSRI